MFTACKLWERTSAKGNRYLTGRMGGVRVLVMENTRPERDGDATHVLLFDEATPYDGARNQAASAEPSSSAPANGHAHRNGRKPPIAGDGVTLPEDEIPF